MKTVVSKVWWAFAALCVTVSARADDDGRVWVSHVHTFASSFSVSTFNPSVAITVTNVRVELGLSTYDCASSPVIQIVANGAAYQLALASRSNDSGPLSLAFAAGVPITLSVGTPAQCPGIATSVVTVFYQSPGAGDPSVSVPQDIQAIQASISGINSKLGLTTPTLLPSSDVDTALQTIASELPTTGAAVSTLATQAGACTSQLASQDAVAAALQSQVVTLQTLNSAQTSQITALQAQITALQTQLQALQNPPPPPPSAPCTSSYCPNPIGSTI
jgi:hypothetical protein